MRKIYIMMVAAVAMVATGGAGAARAAFTTIEGFESGNLSAYTTVAGPINASVSPAFAHDGSFGLGISDPGNPGWIYRNDAPVTVSQGDTISAWVNFNNSADSRAYFGFGSSAAGTLSFVLAPNTGDIRFQENPGYGFTELNASAQTFQADKWYRAEVQWGVGGSLTGRLYDSDGTTLLNTVNANSNLFTTGGIAFRGFGGVKAFDTIQREGAEAVPAPAGAVLFGFGLASLGGAGLVRRRRPVAA